VFESWDCAIIFQEEKAFVDYRSRDIRFDLLEIERAQPFLMLLFKKFCMSLLVCFILVCNMVLICLNLSILFIIDSARQSLIVTSLQKYTTPSPQSEIPKKDCAINLHVVIGLSHTHERPTCRAIWELHSVHHRWRETTV
jgi:hypothetical protein